jgi:hypothetical protein
MQQRRAACAAITVEGDVNMAEYTSTGTQGYTKQGNGSSMEGGLTGAANEAASGLMAQVKSRASSQVAAQQARAAEGLGSVASALRKAGNELRAHNEGLASYADMAVEELEHISSRIRDKSPGEYVTDLEHFARSRPAAFVGGTFLLGLGLARFLKSTQPRRPRAYPRYATGRGSYRGYQGQRGYGNQEHRGFAGQDRGYDAPGGTSDRWPESTGSVTPPAPGRTPTSATGASGTTGTPLTTATQRASVTSDPDAARSTAQSDSGIQETAEASSRGGMSAASRGRGTGE